MCIIDSVSFPHTNRGTHKTCFNPKSQNMYLQLNYHHNTVIIPNGAYWGLVHIIFWALILLLLLKPPLDHPPFIKLDILTEAS